MMNDKLALIIEDTPEIADIFSYVLQQAGFETEIIADGETALERLDDSERDTPTVVVLDMNLPKLDGQSVLRHIRADERLADIQVIVATANPRMAETVRDQADIVLIKPVSYDQLHTLSTRLAQKGSPDK